MIIFLKFKLCDFKFNYQEHAVVVRSIGWLAEPCNNLLGEENLIEIFTILSLQVEEKYLKYILYLNYLKSFNYPNFFYLVVPWEKNLMIQMQQII